MIDHVMFIRGYIRWTKELLLHFHTAQSSLVHSDLHKKCCLDDGGTDINK